MFYKLIPTICMAFKSILAIRFVDCFQKTCYNQHMKLNADIIYYNLIKKYPTEILGYRSKDLCLSRPEFFMEGSDTFKTNHLYILSGDRISKRVVCERGSVIICTGELPQMSYYYERCCFIKVTGSADIFSLFNHIQNIFNKYDLWNDSLIQSLEHGGSIQDLVDLSEGIFENPILVLDSRFRFLARCGYEAFKDVAEAVSDSDSDELSIDALDKYLNDREPLMHVKEPMLLNILDTSTLSINLFENDEYTGSLSVEYRNRPHHECDIPLIKHLSEYILSAMRKNSATIMTDRSITRKVFLDIINGLPIDTTHRKHLERIHADKTYLCLVFRTNTRFAQVPIEYIIAKVESAFRQSITFESRSDIISFLELPETQDEAKAHSELEQSIDLLVGTMDLKVGISSSFSDPYSARIYYLQALAALENGIRIHPNDKFYNFKNYALNELISNAQNDLPLDTYYSDGLRRLISHDEESHTSYLETLRVYLNNNMAATKTASDLFIHRSTLLERLERINTILGEDLKDPDVRLQYLIILKAMEIEEQLK